MASCQLREIQSSDYGNGTGLPFYTCCLAWFLTKILGYTDFDGDSSVLDYHKTGTNGEFNLTGTDENFRDSVANSFSGGDTGAWLVVKDSVSRNCGIYQITAVISSSTITLDFRSGTTEFPTSSTGIEWWLFSSVASAAVGSITPPDGDAITDNTYVKLDDGQGINNQRVLIFSRKYTSFGPPPVLNTWAPNQWRGGITPLAKVTQNNKLSGKTLNILVGIISGSVTFTGSNPLSLDNIVSQINTAFGGYGEVCYRSDYLGYKLSYGLYITFRANGGEPDPPPGAALNNITIYYSGSTAWEELGFSGTSNLTAPDLIQAHKQCDNRPPPDTELAAAIATVIRTTINGWTNWWVTAFGSGATVGLENDYKGTHGNHSMTYGGSISVSGMSGGTLPGFGSSFTCKTPHANGWALYIETVANLTNPYIEIGVSTNGTWDGTGETLGPVYFGATGGSTNWLYADGDTNGEWINIYIHQATNNRYNGAIIAHVSPIDTKAAEEKVVLLGNTSYLLARYDGGNFARTYDTYHLGHGYVWNKPKNIKMDCWMVEQSYTGYASGLSKWTSRERNRRFSGSSSAGGGTGDSIAVAAGVVTLTDAAAVFLATDVGKRIRITGATNAGNNGSFIITTYVSATQIKFDNASGVAETSAFTWSMDQQDVVVGTMIVVDPLNLNGYYELLGYLKGHYSVRGGAIGGWAARKAFDCDGYLDLFHLVDGLAFNWGNVTAQH